MWHDKQGALLDDRLAQLTSILGIGYHIPNMDSATFEGCSADDGAPLAPQRLGPQVLYELGCDPAVCRGDPEHVAFRLEEPRVVGIAQAVSRRGDCLQNWLQLVRRAGDDAE